MTDPTTNALLARIKELEEALNLAKSFIEDQEEAWGFKIPTGEAIRKALNK